MNVDDIMTNKQGIPNKDDILVEKVGDFYVVGYLVRDDAPLDYWEWGEEGIFEEFQTQEEQGAFIDKIEAQKKVYFLVDKHVHEYGRVHFSIALTMRYPDRPCAVYVPPDDIQDRYKRGGSLKAKVELMQFSNSVLDEYSKVRNDDVYEVTSCLYQDGKEVENTNNTCCGFKGYEYALSMLRTEFFPPAKEQALSLSVPRPDWLVTVYGEDENTWTLEWMLEGRSKEEAQKEGESISEQAGADTWTLTKIMSQEEYIKRNLCVCPACESDDLHSETMKPDGEGGTVKVICFNCNALWLDTYKFTGFINLQRLNESRTGLNKTNVLYKKVL